MKKLAIALAALPAAVAVQAQSTNVQLYGLVDAGVEVVNHASATGGKVTRLTSGGMNTSRFGIRGNEDLGGGLKAIFQLEGGLFIDEGKSDGALFGRQANVGLEGGFGRVIAGRSYTTAYDFILPFDPMGYAPAYSWASTGHGTPVNATAGTPVNKYGMTTAANNLIKYQGTFSGVKVGATYAFGEQTTGTSDGATVMLGLGYAAGPFSTAATYERTNGLDSATGHDKTTVAQLGVAYALSDAWSLKGAYRHYKKDFASAAAVDLRGDTLWAGVNFQATPALGLTAAVYRVNVKDQATGPEADPMMFVVRAKYALSKRTDLYAVAAHARAKNDQFVGLTRNGSTEGVTGFSDTQSGAMVGVQHRF